MTLSNTSYHHIYIWMPVGVRQFGHASLELSNGEHISWWPQVDGALSGLKKQQSLKHCLVEDMIAEDMEPDYEYRISSTKLDLDLMKKYWGKRKDMRQYSLLSQNCCYVVYRVLRAGGAPKSLTIVWRPETLRRYLVIYLGGGSDAETLFNMPGWDSPFKEKITLHTWEPKAGKGHFALSLDESVYVSWWPRCSMSPAHAASSLEEDRRNIGRVEDKKYTFPANELECHLMRRRWKHMMKHETSTMWNTTSDWVVCNILYAGGMSFYRLGEIMSENRMFETSRRELHAKYDDYKKEYRRLDVFKLHVYAF